MMATYQKQIPGGVQDYLQAECYHKRRVERALRETFMMSGYDEVETPSFEYYDVYSESNALKQERMIKFFDPNGRILALRPDFTMPIARLCATRMEGAELPLRLCYVGSAFGNDADAQSQRREFTQAGVELLGLPGAKGDAEVIALAIVAMKEAGLTDFQIDIGQVEFFRGLMDQVGMNERDAEQLREYVEQKNELAIELMLKNYPMGGEIKSDLQRLPMLYGGPEVLDEAQAISSHPRCRAAIDNLREVYALLEAFGLSDYVSIDLGMVQAIGYYTGVIFKGMTGALGYPLLTGGRYDHLLRAFGRDLPATGFALGVKEILLSLDSQSALRPQPGVQVLVGADASCVSAAYAYAQKLRGEGIRTAFCLGCLPQQVVSQARQLGVPKAAYADANGVRQLIEVKEGEA